MVRTKVAKTLIWSDRANAEIAAIADFYDHRNGNSDYSERLWFEFQQRMSYVVDNPYSGEKWKTRGFRFVVVNPFQLFYYVTKTEIVVASVWDARRDPKTLKLSR